MTLPPARRVYWIAVNWLAVGLLCFPVMLALLWMRGAPDVFFGYGLRQFHEVAGTVLWALLALAFLFGVYRRPCRAFWWALTGLVSMQALFGFLGYVLPFGQVSFWLAAHGVPVGLSLLQTVFPAAVALILVLHLRQMTRLGPPAPHFGRYTRFGLVVMLLALAAGLWSLWQGLGATLARFPSEAVPPSVPGPTGGLGAGPLATPAHIVPDWHALPAYSVLRAVPDKAGGLIAFAAFLATWVALPWLDRGPAGPVWRRAGVRWVVAVVIGCTLALGVTGALPAEGAALWIGRGAMALFFVTMLVLLPWVTGRDRAAGPATASGAEGRRR